MAGIRGVHIRGGGIAALCVQHLLKQADIPVGVEPAARTRLPAILLSDTALTLLRDVFERPTLFSDIRPLTKRVVAWRRGEPPVTLPHSAIVVSEEQLLQALHVDSHPIGTEPDWTLHSSRPVPEGTEELHFGTRIASTSIVELLPHTATDAFWIEALPTGWLFLIPAPDRTGWLLSVGNAPDQLLASSQLISGLTGKLLTSPGQFPAYPRLLSSLHGPNWLACGTAAMAFDPICGDGTANAVREAILAAAALRAIHRGFPAERVLEYYESRLLAGFARHLMLTREFYFSGERGNWWLGELDGLQSGLAWCRAKAGPEPRFHYRLDGFDLQPVEE